MRKEAKPSPTESPLRFEADPEPASEVLTALGGLPLSGPTGERPAAGADQRTPAGLRGSDVSFVILNAAGGDCLED